MTKFGCVDVALSLAVECLESLMKLGQRARVVVRVRADSLEDGQNFLELVRLLSCTSIYHVYVTVTIGLVWFIGVNGTFSTNKLCRAIGV